MFIQQLMTEARQRPLEYFIGLCVFLVAVFGAVVKDVASSMFLILIVISFIYIKQWPQAWRNLGQVEKLFLSGFLLYLVSGFLSYVNVVDDYDYIKQMGRYLRFALIVPLYLFLVHSKFELTRFFVPGIVVSGPVYLLFAAYTIYNNQGLPGMGYYHHILFGDAAMLNSILMMVFLLTRSFSFSIRLLIVISMFCALYASVLSTARGAWIAAPLIIVILIWHLVKSGRIGVKRVGLVIAVLTVVVSLSPAIDIVTERYTEAISEIKLFYSGEGHETSVGGRLAMWDIAIDVWKENPVLGTGPGDYGNDLMNLKNQGRYPALGQFDATHNIYLQVLASNGMVGILIFLPTLIIFPLIYIRKAAKDSNRLECLSALVLIVSVSIFGLTESWIVRSPFIAIFAVYFSVLFTGIGNVASRRTGAG
jgi:O-antigen ligase